jgi:hypothetical protein
VLVWNPSILSTTGLQGRGSPGRALFVAGAAVGRHTKPSVPLCLLWAT